MVMQRLSQVQLLGRQIMARIVKLRFVLAQQVLVKPLSFEEAVAKETFHLRAALDHALINPQLCVLYPVPATTENAVATVGGRCICPDNYERDDDGNCKETCSQKPHRFACTDGLCIYSYQIGNGIKDCKDDETPEWSTKNLCTKYMKEHASTDPNSDSFFMCKNATEAQFSKSNIPEGYCVSPRGLCDGIYDCADQSDELDCPNFDCIPGRKVV